jgi:enamine deaminase RidA (YjgF/YER057c/UK114 family)
MAEEKSTTSLPPKGIGNIKAYDFIKALYYAILGTLFTFAMFMMESIFQNKPHFPTWIEMLPYLKAIIGQSMVYIAGQLGINNVGQILTKDKSTVRIDVDTLKELKEKVNN